MLTCYDFTTATLMQRAGVPGCWLVTRLRM